MKKFVGNVNGKTFDNEAEFLKAATEATKKIDENLSISSYYRYSDDAECDDDKENENENKNLVEDPKFVSTYEYFLGGRNPDSETENGVEYKVSDELRKRIIEASNRDDIKKSVTFHIGKLENNIKEQERFIKDILEKGKELTKKLEQNHNLLNENNSTLVDLKSRRFYYESLLDIIGEQEAIEKKKQEDDNEKKKNEEKVNEEKRTSLLGISAYEFLKQLGFIK